MDRQEAPETVFLLSAKDRLTAGAYEEMLKKGGVAVRVEIGEPGGGLGALMDPGGPREALPYNIYAPRGQLERARALADAFDCQPVVFKGPPPALNRKSRKSQIVFILALFLIFAVPIGLSLYAIVERILRSILR